MTDLETNSGQVKKHHHAYEINQPKKNLIPLRLRGKRQNKKGPLIRLDNSYRGPRQTKLTFHLTLQKYE